MQTQTQSDRHGWINTEVVKTRFGDFEFKNGYPTRESATALLDQLKFNRAIEVYLTQIPAVAIIESRRGVREFGAVRSNQVIIWENLMDAKTLVLTANTETVYGMGFLDLKSDGPTVIEVPPKMLGAAMDTLQRYLVDIGPLGPDKGKGGKYLFLPPGYKGEVPEGYFVIKSPTYSVNYFIRGFKVDGKTDQAVALMKQIKVYPLDKANQSAEDGVPQRLRAADRHDPLRHDHVLRDARPTRERRTGRRLHAARALPHAGNRHREGQAIQSRREDTSAALGSGPRSCRDGAGELLRVERPRHATSTRSGKWQYVGDVPYTFVKDGILEVDRRAYVYYMALGNSPAMMDEERRRRLVLLVDVQGR